MTKCKNCHYEFNGEVCPVCQTPIKKRINFKKPKITWENISKSRNTFIFILLLICWLALDMSNPELMNKPIELPQRIVMLIVIIIYALKVGG
jgi:hypothetical protein